MQGTFTPRVGGEEHPKGPSDLLAFTQSPEQG